MSELPPGWSARDECVVPIALDEPIQLTERTLIDLLSKALLHYGSARRRGRPRKTHDNGRTDNVLTADTHHWVGEIVVAIESALRLTGRPLDELLDAAHLRVLENAHDCRGNNNQAALSLGMNRTTFVERMKRLRKGGAA